MEVNLKLKNDWYGHMYDEHVKDVLDISLIQELLGADPLNVLEVACGSGRILSQIALKGHTIKGIEYDPSMVALCERKIENYHKAKCFHQDAFKEDWGQHYDVVILAGNLLLNIITDEGYQASQEKLIEKASKALKKGGHLYLDFDCFDRGPSRKFDSKERIIFQGEDPWGTKGHYSAILDAYDQETKIETSFRKYDLKTKSGEIIYEIKAVEKYFPSFEEVLEWLDKHGFVVETTYGDFEKRPISKESYKAIIWARKS